MAKGDLSIFFYLHPTKSKDGKHQVYLRIIYHRKKAELATKFFVAPDKWEFFQKKNIQFDEEQARIKKELYRIKNRLEDETAQISVSIIKDIFIGKTKRQIYLLDFFDSFINRISSLKEYTSDNVNKYRKTREYIAEFMISSHKKKDISISDTNYKFISDLDDFLMKYYLPKLRRTLERNTVNQHHTRLRTILLRAVRESVIPQNPYNDFKLTDEEKPPRYLTEQELQLLINHSLGDNPSLQRVRDIFIFSVYTGLRFGDAQKLKNNQVIVTNRGEYFIQTEQSKTGDPVHLPMFKQAVDIFNKYNNEERKITGCVLPRISNQKINTFLKTIAELVGIQKKLTHHVARHTCATTILLSNGVPLEATAQWLGQRDLKSTRIYAKVTNPLLNQIRKKIEG